MRSSKIVQLKEVVDQITQEAGVILSKINKGSKSGLEKPMAQILALFGLLGFNDKEMDIQPIRLAMLNYLGSTSKEAEKEFVTMLQLLIMHANEEAGVDKFGSGTIKKNAFYAGPILDSGKILGYAVVQGDHVVSVERTPQAARRKARGLK